MRHHCFMHIWIPGPKCLPHTSHQPRTTEHGRRGGRKIVTAGRWREVLWNDGFRTGLDQHSQKLYKTCPRSGQPKFQPDELDDLQTLPFSEE